MIDHTGELACLYIVIVQDHVNMHGMSMHINLQKTSRSMQHGDP